MVNSNKMGSTVKEAPAIADFEEVSVQTISRCFYKSNFITFQKNLVIKFSSITGVKTLYKLANSKKNLFIMFSFGSFPVSFCNVTIFLLRY